MYALVWITIFFFLQATPERSSYTIRVLFATAVRVGLIDSRFIVTESVDSSITVCAELQDGFLGRNISLMVVNVDSNGEIM